MKCELIFYLAGRTGQLEELLEVCHRILVMHMGHIIGEVYPEDLTIEQLYADCMGGKIE